MERRLAAVLAADLVGYSRLVRADEEGTVTTLKKLYETVIAPAISRHHGRVVKLMGDGMLEFWMMGLFWAYHASQRYEEAVATAQKSIRIAPNNPTFRRQLAAAYAWLDRPAEARQAVADYLQLEPSHTLADAAKVPSRIAEHVGRFVEGLRRAGLPE